jgi:16S rRNA C967 or C1407 C5-methylase (RsmB/RsmF family)/NOL1/NOP2/fmu family ribosome biogenesis protein
MMSLMFPEKFLKRINDQKYIDADILLEALQEPSPVSIRVNKSKWSGKPVNAEEVSWCNTGYYLKARPSYTLDPLFHSGCYYPQEASGMFLCEALKQGAGTKKNIRILDLCGAPGGKSILLSDLTGEEGMLVANEVIRSRAAILSETITKWGSGNTIVTQNDPSAFSGLPGYFDMVVADAPCSGEGMFRNPVAVREWSVDNSLLCSERQKRIIMDVWPALKENGILIYSTCTFNPGENEENIKWFIENNAAECLRLNIEGFKGITEIDHNGIFGYGFYPGLVKGEGFFIAVIRKLSGHDSSNQKHRMKHELRPSKKDMDIGGSWSSVLKDRLIRQGDGLLALPCSPGDYSELSLKLKVIKPGTKIAVIKKDDYIPTHELALSVNMKEDTFPKTEVDYQTALAYLSRGNILPARVINGWNILSYRGINLGFVKNIGKRINNYFPVEWRIRMNLPEPGNENIIDWGK